MEKKDDLRPRFLTLLEDMFAHPPNAREVKQYRFMHTSGTTGIPLPVVCTGRRDCNPAFLGRGTRTLMLFGSKPLRLDFARTFADPDTPKSDIMFCSLTTSAQENERIWREWRPDAIASPPSVLLRFTRAWPENARAQVTSVILAGEFVSKVVSDIIHERFQHARIENYYPATETGLIGTQCSLCAWNEFHPVDGVTFSIHEPDADGRGDLLLSKENPGGIAFTDYRVGDVASESNHNGHRVIVLYGRRGFDYIKLAEALLVREEFDRVAMELERYIDDYRAELTTRIEDGVPKHHLTLQVIATPDATRTGQALADHLAAEVSSRLFVTPHSTLKDAVENEIFAPLTVLLVDTITHTTAKPQRLIRVDA
ncbi:MAG: hypothetical protein WDZ93_01535 [Candidatus Paceibacterota bacterium]